MSLEIFKTNIESPQEAEYLLRLLRLSISDGVIYFNQQDGGQILHIDINREISDVVSSLAVKHGFYCQKLIKS